jgi:hypothetical protein
MSFGRSIFLRRRPLYKLILLGLITYITYLSFAAVGHIRLGYLNVDSNGPDANISPEKLTKKIVKESDRQEPFRKNVDKYKDEEVNRNEPKFVDNNLIIDHFQNGEDDETRRARLLIEKHDNMKDYEKIKLNGQQAKGMKIDPKQLTVDEKEKFDDGWNKYAFNEYASRLIPLNRTLPDNVRLTGCKSDPLEPNLGRASIIMCFHNEAWTVLLRGIYSIINRSPAHLLEEILLVDDYSDFDYLLQPLDMYLKDHFGDKVRVLRNKKREGLIRSRLYGAREARGDVLIFLDSHIEAADGWLEPLLNEIKKNETTVVTPIIDIIDKDTMEYKFSTSSKVSVGGFDWNMQFTWHGLPETEYKLRKSDHGKNSFFINIKKIFIERLLF